MRRGENQASKYPHFQAWLEMQGQGLVCTQLELEKFMGRPCLSLGEGHLTSILGYLLG